MLATELQILVVAVVEAELLRVAIQEMVVLVALA
jgi:hypothetical protein